MQSATAAKWVGGPNAPKTARVVWSMGGYRLHLRSSFEYGGGEIIVDERDEALWSAMVLGGIVAFRV